MAAVVKGGNAYIWGIDTGVVTNGKLQSISITETFNVRAEIMDETGNVIGERLDDVHKTGTATFQFDSSYATGSTYNLAGGADVLTYDSVAYQITGIDRSVSNESYGEITFTIEYIDYAGNQPA